METNIRNTAISKTFIFFGIIIFIISAIDLADLLMPLRLANTEWVFGITQSVIASVLAPALSLVILLTGLYFADNSSKSKKLLNFEKIVGIVSFVFGLVLIANLLVYSLSMKSYETKVISSVKIQKDEVLNKINQLKNIPKLKISESIYTKKVFEINNAATQQIKMAKKQLFKKNVKTIIELFLYICLYIGIAKIAFDSSKFNLLKLKFHK